jgi:hypothetical protein
LFLKVGVDGAAGHARRVEATSSARGAHEALLADHLRGRAIAPRGWCSARMSPLGGGDAFAAEWTPESDMQKIFGLCILYSQCIYIDHKREKRNHGLRDLPLAILIVSRRPPGCTSS